MSLPDITAVADEDGEEEDEEDEEEEEVARGRGPTGQVANGGLAIPPGLPRLHVSREGIDYCHYGSPQFFSDFSPECEICCIWINCRMFSVALYCLYWT